VVWWPNELRLPLEKILCLSNNNLSSFLSAFSITNAFFVRSFNCYSLALFDLIPCDALLLVSNMSLLSVVTCKVFLNPSGLLLVLLLVVEVVLGALRFKLLISEAIETISAAAISSTSVFSPAACSTNYSSPKSSRMRSSHRISFSASVKSSSSCSMICSM